MNYDNIQITRLDLVSTPRNDEGEGGRLHPGSKHALTKVLDTPGAAAEGRRI